MAFLWSFESDCHRFLLHANQFCRDKLPSVHYLDIAETTKVNTSICQECDYLD